MTIGSSNRNTITFKVRRPLRSFLLHIAQTVLMLYLAIDRDLPGRAIWGALFTFGLALTIRIFLKPQYMELNGSKLTIYGDYFRTRTIYIDDIERIEVESGPFSSSKIVLKDNKGYVKFDYDQVSTDYLNTDHRLPLNPLNFRTFTPASAPASTTGPINPCSVTLYTLRFSPWRSCFLCFVPTCMDHTINSR